ncbi:PTS transporter subunit EIIC [Paenibacillus thiaminolyticus]|nr:PTS transporter subunit EIIC [Paenibacillus thiaminolyticus]
MPFFAVRAIPAAKRGDDRLENISSAFNPCCSTLDRKSFASLRFMSGRFITMVFGLLGGIGDLSQSQAGEEEGGLRSDLSAALTSFLTGMTEPLEFSFLFIAPFLYVIHAFFDGLAFMLAPKTNWLMVPVIDVVWFCLYYFTFQFLIVTFNLKTPAAGHDYQKRNRGIYGRILS